MTVIPMMIDLTGSNVIVIGGGQIAKRKLDTLLSSEAEVTVVSPAVTPEIHALYTEKKIKWKQKEFEPEDVANAFLIIIATNDPVVNNAAIKAAPANSLINASSDAEAGNIHFPAHFKRGKLSIAVSTNGASPMLAKKIKQELQSHYSEDYEQYLDFLFEARHLLKQAKLSKQAKENFLREFLSESFLQTPIQQQILRELRSLVHEKKGVVPKGHEK